MTADRKDVWTLISYIQDDLRNVQGKLVELRAQLATMSLPDAKEPVLCPECELPFGGRRSLVNHRYTSHDIPWSEVERVEAELGEEAAERKRRAERKEGAQA